MTPAHLVKSPKKAYTNLSGSINCHKGETYQIHIVVLCSIYERRISNFLLERKFLFTTKEDIHVRKSKLGRKISRQKYSRCQQFDNSALSLCKYSLSHLIHQLKIRSNLNNHFTLYPCNLKTTIKLIYFINNHFSIIVQFFFRPHVY